MLSSLTFGKSFEPRPGGQEADLFTTFFGLNWHPDWEFTACMMLWGYNALHAENETYFRIVAAHKRGAKLIVVDPRRTEVAEHADIHMQVRPGTDACIAMGMINVMLSRELYDKTFVRDWTNGPFLVRTDNGDLLTEKGLSPKGSQKKYIVWDEVSESPKSYDPATVSFKSSEVVPALMGTYKSLR